MLTLNLIFDQLLKSSHFLDEAASVCRARVKIAQAILFHIIVTTGVTMPATYSLADVYQPVRVGNVVKHATALIEQGKLDEAENLLKRAIAQVSDKRSLPLRNLIATLYQSRKDFVAEAATYHDILQIAPDNVEAERARSFAILRMGAPDLATDYATEIPDAFSSEEMHSMQQAQAGRLIKWGEIEARYGIGPERFNATDKGIEKNTQILLALERAEESNSPSALNAEYDRIVALRNRVRMKEAIEYFLEIQRRGIDMPPYVLAAAADAYLYLREPKRARDLYLQALELSEKNLQYPEREWQFG